MLSVYYIRRPYCFLVNQAINGYIEKLLDTINVPWICENNLNLQPEALERVKADANQSMKSDIVETTVDASSSSGGSRRDRSRFLLMAIGVQYASFLQFESLTNLSPTSSSSTSRTIRSQSQDPPQKSLTTRTSL
ncbi:unnamed protein product [Rotaria sordida]|uniref:Uncharacterized protein n=1 Tax=Rotaria sordida TaxID=392033 RepID=A0A814UY33_9BILA|nr:unnamed protein product [Rotaria sordida]CAF1179389.1 unnamed protein product [Rotaria sordida]